MDSFDIQRMKFIKQAIMEVVDEQVTVPTRLYGPDGKTLVDINNPLATDNLFEITPSDEANLAHSTEAIYVGISGDIKLITTGGNTVILKNLQAGIWHPIKATKVFDTDTDATSIIGSYKA